MRSFLVTANLVEVAIVHNCNSHREAILMAQYATYEHRPKLWKSVENCEWLANSDIPARYTKPLVELL